MWSANHFYYTKEFFLVYFFPRSKLTFSPGIARGCLCYSITKGSNFALLLFAFLVHLCEEIPPSSTGGEKKSGAAINTASLTQAEAIYKEETSNYNVSNSNALQSNGGKNMNINKNTSNEIKKSAHSTYRCRYHIMFAPKYRRKKI